MPQLLAQAGLERRRRGRATVREPVRDAVAAFRWTLRTAAAAVVMMVMLMEVMLVVMVMVTVTMAVQTKVTIFQMNAAAVEACAGNGAAG